MSTLSVLLIKAPGVRLSPADVRALVDSLAPALPALLEVAAHTAIAHAETYVYLRCDITGDTDAVVARASAALAALHDAWELVPLHLLASAPGASAGKHAPYHYVVETDVVDGGEQELNSWYDQEHLPGLASVQGNVLAERFKNPTGSPRYHACYELETTGTMGSPAWLAVRHTAWSDIVRPMFMNAKRTMFDHISTFKP